MCDKELGDILIDAIHLYEYRHEAISSFDVAKGRKSWKVPGKEERKGTRARSDMLSLPMAVQVAASNLEAGTQFPCGTTLTVELWVELMNPLLRAISAARCHLQRLTGPESQ
jgi:hypothetical protein